MVQADGGGAGAQVRDKLNELVLSNEAVLVREHLREEAYGKVQAPWFIKLPFNALCWTLDVVFNNRPIQRCTLCHPSLLSAARLVSVPH